MREGCTEDGRTGGGRGEHKKVKWKMPRKWSVARTVDGVERSGVEWVGVGVCYAIPRGASREGSRLGTILGFLRGPSFEFF